MNLDFSKLFGLVLSGTVFSAIILNLANYEVPAELMGYYFVR